jgi:hypothetical protein
MAYAANTKVSPESSRTEIERTLARYGADAFGFGYQDGRAIVSFRCEGRHVRFEVQTPALSEFERTRGGVWRSEAQQRAAQGQALRQRWRALALLVKAKLEAVEAGIETFEAAFLPYVVLPSGETVGEALIPQVAAAYETGTMPSLLPGVAQLEAG